jgi:uncharacterized protein YcfL
MNKYKIGDKVKIVKYGSLIWINRTASTEMEIYKDKEDLSKEHPTIKTIDEHPELIEQEGIIDSFQFVQNKYEYSLKDPWKHAWYDENQLELIN